jgi:tRNA A-37 threonylcarbamoyl transferase component Bud32
MPVSRSRAERCIRIVVERPNNSYLIDVLSRLGPEALLHVAGLRSDQPKPPKVRVQPLSRPGIHPVGAVHITDGVVRTSLFAKVQTPQYSGVQSLEREVHFLSDVAPLIALEDPRLRSPLPIAYYPELGLLLMEFVKGHSLKHCLFDANLAIGRKNECNLAELLRCAGRWLGTMHSLTLQQGAYGNPLEWLLQEFENSRTVEAFSLYSLRAEYTEMLSILQKCVSLKPMFRRNLCNVHGEFTPIHVMVADEAIYVVDFGNSKLGYRYEDVGLFAGFYDCLQPWRAAAGSLRIKLDVQKSLFFHGYFEHSASPFNDADKAIMSWVRLISFARMLNGWQQRYNGFGKRAYCWLTLGTLRDRFTLACRTELEALRDMQVNIFDERDCAEQQAGSEHCERSADITHTTTSG